MTEVAHAFLEILGLLDQQLIHIYGEGFPYLGLVGMTLLSVECFLDGGVSG